MSARTFEPPEVPAALDASKNLIALMSTVCLAVLFLSLDNRPFALLRYSVSAKIVRFTKPDPDNPNPKKTL